VVSFTPRPFYHRGKSLRYPLDRRLGGPPEPVWTQWRREKIPPSVGNRICPARTLVTKLTELFRPLVTLVWPVHSYRDMCADGHHEASACCHGDGM